MNFELDFRSAVRGLRSAKGLTFTVVVALALGIGANAAIFSLVRGVLLRPLVNRDEARLVYIRHSAPGIAVDNATFFVPEIEDVKRRMTTISAFGDFSTITFTVVGLGEPRQLRAGVVSGSFFDVMGLKPVLGRLINAGDDGPNAAGVAVLTHAFWTTSMQSDPNVVGKNIRFGSRAATVVGVLEPSVPYPAETELIANVVTSPHHMSATMVTGREHRMTELFGRLAPGAEIEDARAELRAVHGAMVKEYPASYPQRAGFRIDVVGLRDQITARARTVLLVLLAASALVFVIACANVVNLVLARTVRRESELALRAALGAGSWALRRTLLAESVLLCASGAVVGVAIAQPMVSVLARYAARFSVRARDITLDPAALAIGVALALVAAVFLAFVPRLPSADRAPLTSASGGGVRITPGTTRRLRIFAVAQIAASFVLLAGAAVLIRTLVSLQARDPGFETERVLAINVPIVAFGRSQDQIRTFYRDVHQRVRTLPGVQNVAFGSTVPWRDAGNLGNAFVISGEGQEKISPDDEVRARFRSISPGFFATLGVPIVEGRDFNEGDRNGAERVVIVSRSLANALFPDRSALDRHVRWTDPVMKFINVSGEPRRIVGVIRDMDDERMEPSAALTVYHPFEQELGAGRLFVHAQGDPYALVAPISRMIRELAADQPVERAATLADVRAEVIEPTRLNALVFGGVATVALAIALVGVAGVLAFLVSGRTREFGIRLAIGSQPRDLLLDVLREGAVISAIGLAAGSLTGWGLVRFASSYLPELHVPGAIPLAGSAGVLLAAAVLVSILPARRAARVDVNVALRAE